MDSYSEADSAGVDVTSQAASTLTVGSDNEPVLVFGMCSTNAGGPNTGVVGLQQEIGRAANSLSSTISGLSGSTASYTWLTSGIAAQMLVYQVAFTPAISNSVKVVGFTVKNLYTSVSSVALNIPSGLSNGDTEIAHVAGPSGGTITPPSGWSAISGASADDGTNLAKAFYHIYAAGDPSSITFTFSGSCSGSASIIAFRDASAGVFTAANSTTQGLTPTLTGITAKSLVLMYETCSQNRYPTPVGVPQDMFMTPFVYNPALSGGSISYGGALSVLLQTGANGGSVGQQYRAAYATNSGPQITIAIVAAPPATPSPGYKRKITVLKILQAQRRTKVPVKLLRPTLFQKIAHIIPPGPPTPPPISSQGIRQNLWISPKVETVYEIFDRSTRITPED